MAEMGPADHGRIEAELGLVLGRQRVVQVQQPVDAENGLRLRVRAVQLDVRQGPVHLVLAFLEAGTEIGLAAPQRQRLQSPLGHVDGP